MLRNIFSNWALALIQLIVLIQLTPVQVRALGAPAQGAWLTIASLTSLLGLLIMGIPMASVRFLAGHVARRETERANQVIATCLGLSLGLGAAALTVGAALSIPFNLVYLRSEAWRSLGPEVLGQARIAYWLVVVQVGCGFAGQLPFGILDAHDDFIKRNGVKVAGLLVRVALIVVVLRRHPSLVVLGLVQISVMVTEFLVALWLIRRSLFGIRFGLRGFDRGRLREIFGFSSFVMLLSVGNQLSFQTDQLVINAFSSPENGTFFDIGNKFFPPLSSIVLGIGTVIMPKATKLQATGELDELRRQFLKWSKVASSIALLVGVFLLVLGPEFIAFWMGLGFSRPSGAVARVLMVAYLFFLPVRGVASPVLMGLGKPAAPALSLLAMGLVNLVVSLLLVRPFGIVGVAVGTAVPCVLYAAVVAYLACRELDISLVAYARHVLARPALGSLLPALLVAALKWGAHLFPTTAPRCLMFLRLAAAGSAMVIVFGVVWVFFVYRADPYVDASATVERFLPRALRRKTQAGK